MSHAVAHCQICEQKCEGTPAKIKLWMKLHHKKAHGLKFEGIDFHGNGKMLRTRRRNLTKDDYVRMGQHIEMLKTTTTTLDFIQSKNGGFLNVN